MLHRTRTALALVAAAVLLISACTPTIGPIAIGCSLVQGSYTVHGIPAFPFPGPFPGPIPGPITWPDLVQVLDAQGNVVASANVPVSPTDTLLMVSIPINPSRPEGTVLTVVHVVLGPLATGPCTGGTIVLPDAPHFFDPGDGRVAPLPGDRLAIYCHQPPGSLDVWGVDDQSKGFRLATFTFDALAAAGPTGLSATVDPNGIISVSMDEQGNLWAAWNGGVHGADGQPDHGFAKGFHCG